MIAALATRIFTSSNEQISQRSIVFERLSINKKCFNATISTPSHTLSRRTMFTCTRIIFRWTSMVFLILMTKAPSTGNHPQTLPASGQFALLEKSLRSYCQYLSPILRSHQRKTRAPNLPPLPWTFPDWNSAKSSQRALHQRRLHVSAPCAPYAKL